MINYLSTSNKLIRNTINFLYLKKYRIFSLLSGKNIFVGWGRRKSGQKAVSLAKKYHTSFMLLEDGFIRSIGLGVDGSPSFSLVEDDVGIYYDATVSSKLENILNTYDFKADKALMATVQKAIALIKKHKISKYNNALMILPEYLKNDTKKVLIVAQTAGDASLKYGLASDDPQVMIRDAKTQYPDAEIYVKVHPDVLAGKKASNIDVAYSKEHCKVITENVNPIVLLEAFDAIYTQTSQMGFEALLYGKKVKLYGMPFYAGWDIGNIELRVKSEEIGKVLERRTRRLSVEEVFAGAYILYTRYYNPYAKRESDIIDTIETIVKYREILSQNDGKLYFFGFTRWKRKQTERFFPPLTDNRIHFCNSLDEARSKGLDRGSRIFVWGRKAFDAVEEFARWEGVAFYRVEDGFVRSVSLGSDLTKAYSLVVDSRGIYFDPSQASDLEHLLDTHDFDERTLDRARRLREYLVKKKLSKYNASPDRDIELPGLKEGQKVVMVPGQVEDDASVIYGAWGMSNRELLRAARENEPGAYIVYKPHPDVLAGNRKGHIPEEEARRHADAVITHVSLDSVLERCDAVHTMTSLVGFEALMRGKEVTTYGMPFYAGWGLTRDMKHCKRRRRQRSLDELVAAAYILYPRYIHPSTGKLCEVEALLEEIDREKERYNRDCSYRAWVNLRNFVSRKGQLILRWIVGEGNNINE